MKTNVEIPADLMPIIFQNLPVKSLLRFRCVSKSWLAMVDDPKFARSHLNNFRNNSDETRLFVIENRDGSTAVDCDVRSIDTFDPIPETHFSFSDDRWTVVLSIDGLILLKSSIKKVNFLKLWNPSIRKFREIPPLKHKTEARFIEEKVVGLGYDPLANDYKLVILIFVKEKLHSVAIYSLEAGSWKRIKFRGKGSSCSTWHWRIYEHLGRAYFRGSLYLIAMKEQSDRVWDLLSFDLSKEMFSCISTPDNPFVKSSDSVSYGDLALINNEDSLAVFDSISPEKSVWVLDYESMRWTKRLDYESMRWTKHLHYNLDDTEILYFKKNGDMLMRFTSEQFIYDHEDGFLYPIERYEVRLYNPEKNEDRMIPNWFSHDIVHVSRYMESLILRSG